MALVTCVDGRALSIVPVPVLDRDGVAYEATLRLLLDAQPFGEVGERCACLLRAAARELRTAGQDGPRSELETGVRRWAAVAQRDPVDPVPDRGPDPGQAWRSLAPYLPRDRELFAFRSRDPDDPSTEGELRVRLLREQTWVAGRGDDRGRWREARSALVEAWGAGGQGVRAVLDEPALLALLDGLLAELDGVGAGGG